MLCESKSTKLDLLTLRKSPYLDQLQKTVPKPKGATPNFGLPKWKHLPLESKIPMVPGLEDIVLSRRKLGEGLRIPFKEPNCLDTSDPYNYEIPLTYDALHDPHLTRFYREAVHVREWLTQRGIVTPELDVRCNLVEYNTYRKYLRKMHGKFISKEIRNKDEIHKEKLMLEVVERLANEKVEKLKKDEKVNSRLEAVRRKRENFVQCIMMKQKMDSDRLEGVRFMKEEMVLRKRLDSQLRRELALKKLAELKKKRKEVVLHALRKMCECDRRLRKFFEETRRKKEKEKEGAFVEKFKSKVKCQEEAIEREARLRECAEKLKEAFLEEYKEKMNRKWEKLHELYLKKRKALKHRPKIRKKSKKETDCSCCFGREVCDEIASRLPIPRPDKPKDTKAKITCDSTL